ncbi:hypothetical protein [Thiobacillus sp.]|uniref:hypothetical protein n=1 Tax=Thiobacillus sp. TaxID=924 RepID=UPI00182AC567|nr:hypothetical protein [Thiobacillus sp.]MBC2732439.1 hypothetical protein [Thiobacillus sp.]MBC2741177.1 hypothetical protein [Thiobacillus sp.]MBC2759868.1 hypothetical protein [Thiobacillus sp.]
MNRSQESEQEKQCRKHGRSVLFLFISYGLLGVLLALFTPTDILNHAWARTLIGVTASVMPTFMDVPTRSPIPDVVRFYFGVMWLALPGFWCVLIYRVLKLPAWCMSRSKAIEVMRSRSRALMLYCYALLFTFAVFYFGAITHLYQPEDGVITRAMFASRTSLSIGASMFNFSLLFFASGVIWFPFAIFHSWKKLPWFYKKDK